MEMTEDQMTMLMSGCSGEAIIEEALALVKKDEQAEFEADKAFMKSCHIEWA